MDPCIGYMNESYASWQTLHESHNVSHPITDFLPTVIPFAVPQHFQYFTALLPCMLKPLDGITMFVGSRLSGTCCGSLG